MTVLLAMSLLAVAPDSSPAGGRAMIEELRRCRTVAEPDRRLACLEAAAARLEQAVDDRSVAVVDREAVRHTRRSLFGFAVPRVALAGLSGGGEAAEAREEIREVSAAVRSVQEVGPDRTEVTLEDESVWRSLEAFRRTPRRGDIATVVRGALGAYFLSAGASHVGTRCIRIR